MRVNRYVASATGLSRRDADKAIKESRVSIDGLTAEPGQEVSANQKVTLDGSLIKLPNNTVLVMLNKPNGYVVSKLGQGAPTIYSTLPEEYQDLKPVGRLDKDSSGLLLLSNNGKLIHTLSHPSFNKEKVYELVLDKVLTKADREKLIKGIKLDDGLSKLYIKKVEGKNLTVGLKEGRNRQIRRTFEAIGYKVKTLHRISFDKYKLNNLKSGDYKVLQTKVRVF